MVPNVGVLERTSEDHRAGFIESSGKDPAGLADRPEFFLRELAGCAGGIDLVVIFGADVMVEEVVEEVTDDGYVILDALFGFDIEDLRETGRPDRLDSRTLELKR